MKPTSLRWAWLVTVALLSLAHSSFAADFVKDVRPILQRACFECHGAEKHESGLRLDRRDAQGH